MPDHVFDYEEIGTRVCGVDFKYEFAFAWDTLLYLSTHLANLTNNERGRKKYKIRFGNTCL